MLIRIKNEFWVDFEEIRLIITDGNGNLKLFYKVQPDYTLIPDNLKKEFLECCAHYTGFPLEKE